MRLELACFKQALEDVQAAAGRGAPRHAVRTAFCIRVLDGAEVARGRDAAVRARLEAAA